MIRRKTSFPSVAAIACIVSVLPQERVAAQQPFPLIDLAPPDPSAEYCLLINDLELPELESVTAEWMAPGRSALPDVVNPGGQPLELPAHCRIRGRIETAIRFEVWLPEPSAWNGRFLATGNTGFGGDIAYPTLASALTQGYATAATDTGHTSGASAWIGNDELLRDFAYRAIYEMTAKSNVIVSEFYGQPAEYRYFNGCSVGGRQGLVEAQRFPADYDGIIAGAPLHDFVSMAVTQLWATLRTRPGTRTPGVLAQDRLALLNQAATAQCDTLDGVADGLIEDPRRCNFDPVSLQCGQAASGRCLSPTEVAVARDIYRGPGGFAADPIAPGFAVGSEQNWSFAAAAEPPVQILDIFRRAIFDDPFWDWRSFDFQADHELAMQQVGWLLNATSADLSAFRDRGGKLLLWHGWNDTNAAPQLTIDYYEAVENALAVAPNPRNIATSEFARLFMVPAMGHCGGGPDTTSFDAQRAIEDWVERGIAPDRIEAESVENGSVVRSRPLCPYPQTARYRGSGNTDRSGSFVCSG